MCSHVQAYHDLRGRYGESHRAYHTLQHIDDCLTQFDTIRHLLSSPADVELALWTHDVIYQPLRSDNEARSADWAEKMCQAPPAVRELIMWTRHGVQPSELDAQLLVDIDLSILGREESIFDEYEANIRIEYRRVPWFMYRKGRHKLLQEFLARPRIYATDVFFERYESQARRNLARSLARLEKSAR